MDERESADLSAHNSPLPYCQSKRRRWQQLAQMVFDMYSTPAMSDEPERVYSITSNTLNPHRNCLTGSAVQQLLYLRNWQKSGVTSLDARSLRQAVLHDGDDGELLPMLHGELQYHEHDLGMNSQTRHLFTSLSQSEQSKHLLHHGL
jgi:hypothetical protein